MKAIKTIEWDGVQITKPGMYSGIPINLYHKPNICVGASISSTGLRAINPEVGSPAHFYAKWSGNPNRVDDDDKRSYILGRALHHLILGEKHFAMFFCVQELEYPDSKTGELKPWNNNATHCRIWHKRMKNKGLTVLTQKEMEQLRNMAQAIANNDLVKRGLFNGLIERSFFWKDKETGIWLKWRPDCVPTDSADFTDLKSTTSVLHHDIVRTIREFSYYQQAALGHEATKQVFDMEMSSFTYLFVEKQPPWCTRDYRVSDEDLMRGARMNRGCIRTFARCLKDNHWPGPGEGNEGNEQVSLSQSARAEIDRLLQLMEV